MIKRVLPSSLLGQTMLTVALALLVAQAISAVLLYRAAENRAETEILNRVALNLLVDPETPSARWRRSIERSGILADDRANPRRPVKTRTSPEAPLLPGEVNMEDRAIDLAEILVSQGVRPYRLQMTERRAGDDPVLRGRAERNPRFAAQQGWADRRIIVAGIQLEDGGSWRTARVPVPPRGPRVFGGIVFQTVVLFLVLMGVLFLILRRIARPLAQLTERVGHFSANPDQAVAMTESGPADMRRLIAAHNAMEARIASLIDEKDVMLGAIGHDLKTPLAALRVRIESVADERERAKMAESIEDITRTLDDILELARVGRPGEQLEVTDLSALIASIADEYEDLGKSVTLSDNPRLAVPLRATLLRRAVRNLIDNALRYGKQAAVSVERGQSHAIIRIDDKGPGIPAQQIAAMLEPFQRGEASRNRQTGGAGLGLTLARAIAEQHGGTLTLVNRHEGGLRAEIRLPL